MGSDQWQPESDDEVQSNERPALENNRTRHLETSSLGSSNSSRVSYHEQFDSLPKFINLVHSVKHRTYHTISSAIHAIRDFAQLPSVQLARGNYFQARKIYGYPIVAKYPVFHLSADSNLEVARGYRPAALELQILFHEPLRQHPNVVHALSIHWTRLSPQNTSCFPVIYVEFALHGTLAQYLDSNTINPETKHSLTQDIARGLQALHSCGITHGDLKPDNILVFSGSGERQGVQAKLSDFGSSVLEDERGTKLRGCTPPWNAPDWCRTFDPSFLNLTDVYSLGLLVWSLALNGKNPFEGQEPESIESRKLSESVLDDAIQSIEQQYDAQVLLCGRVNESARFTAYLYGVSIPRRILQNTLRLDPTKRSLPKVLESLSADHFCG
jgi:serine/threonine protein kinase